MGKAGSRFLAVEAEKSRETQRTPRVHGFIAKGKTCSGPYAVNITKNKQEE